MKGTCPRCGNTEKIESFFSEAAWRRAMAKCMALPSNVGEAAVGYIRAFSTRSMSADRISKLCIEIYDLTTADTVTYKGRTEHVPCRIWAQAMVQIRDGSDRYKPKNNHNLLKAIALSLLDQYDSEAADQAKLADEAQAERARSSRCRTASHLTSVASNETSPQLEHDPLADMDSETRKAWFDRATQALLEDGFQQRFIAAPLVHAKAIELAIREGL